MGGSYNRKYNLHDCGGRGVTASPINNLNQVGGSTIANTCFEHNGKSADSNHHWAIWGDCGGQYVNGGGTTHMARDEGWNRLAYLPGPKKYDIPMLGSCQEIYEYLKKEDKTPITGPYTIKADGN